MAQTHSLNEKTANPCHRIKRAPRDEAMQRQLQNRLKRIIGQLGGMQKMLDQNRYCGDILIQLAAVERSLQSLGYIILEDHMRSCMVEQIQAGNTEIVSEISELVKKLK